MSTPRKVAVSYGNDCLQKRQETTPWVWYGVVAEGAVTLLSAPEKVGKTTLLGLLLDRRRAGGVRRHPHRPADSGERSLHPPPPVRRRRPLSGHAAARRGRPESGGDRLRAGGGRPAAGGAAAGF